MPGSGNVERLLIMLLETCRLVVAKVKEHRTMPVNLSSTSLTQYPEKLELTVRRPSEPVRVRCGPLSPGPSPYFPGAGSLQRPCCPPPRSRGFKHADRHPPQRVYKFREL